MAVIAAKGQTNKVLEPLETIYSGYFSLELNLVWWSETLKQHKIGKPE